MNSKSRLLKRIWTGLLFSASAISFSAYAVPYYWVDWQSWNPAGGTALGIITPSSGPVVNVSFSAITSTGAPGSFLGVTGPTLWTPTTTYESSTVDNAPEYEGIQLVGENNMTYRVTLSEAIKDPLMAISTLGAASDSAKYIFDAPFTILSQGPTCCWGGGTDKLSQSVSSAGYELTGYEGAGVIQFIGTYTTFSWTVPDPEYWHGFTFGIRTTEALEPTPPIPEPEIYAMLGVGLGFMGWAARRRKQKETATA